VAPTDVRRQRDVHADPCAVIDRQNVGPNVHCDSAWCGPHCGCICCGAPCLPRTAPPWVSESWTTSRC
jgi:hypothetical protein